MNAEPGDYPTLGRQLVYKETSKTFRATVSMVQVFDILNWFSKLSSNNLIVDNQ